MLKEAARRLAAQDGSTINQLFVTAIAEKVSALKTEDWFRERQARGDLQAFDSWLQSSPSAPPLPGDEPA